MAIATLSIDLEARLSRMEESLARAERQTAKSSAAMAKSLGSIGDVGAKLGGIFAGLAGAVGVGAILSKVRAVVDGLDAFNDAADATGASIEKLSALEEAGARTGTSFDTVTGILVKFNKVLDEAGDKDSGAARALRAIGLEAEQLRRLDPAEALQRTAQALAGYADDGNKARLVQDLFGKSVREAAPFLKDLAEAGELNGRVTREQADAADRFNKAVATLSANLANLGRQLVGDLLPAINRALEAWNELSKLGNINLPTALRGSIRTGGGLLSGGDFGQGVAETRRVIGDLEADLGRLERAAQGPRGINTEREQARLRERLASERELLQYLQQRVTVETVATNAASYSNEGRGRAVALPSATVPGAEPKPGPASKAPTLDLPARLRLTTRPLDASVNKTLADAAKLEDTWARQAEAAQRFQDQLELSTADLSASLITDAQQRGERQIEIDRQVLQRQLDSLQLYGADRERLQASIDANILARQQQLAESLKPEWQRLVEGWADTTAQMARSWDDLMNGVVRYGEDALTKFIRTGKLGVDDLVDYVQQAIARMIAQKAIGELASIADVLFGGGLGGGLAKGGVVSGGEIQAFASGGIVNRPTYFPMTRGRFGLMGEAGPEAVMPLKRGANGKLGVQASGQAGPTIVVNLPMGVTRGELAAFVPTLKAQIKAELVGSMRRPGFAGG